MRMGWVRHGYLPSRRLRNNLMEKAAQPRQEHSVLYLKWHVGAQRIYWHTSDNFVTINQSLRYPLSLLKPGTPFQPIQCSPRGHKRIKAELVSPHSADQCTHDSLFISRNYPFSQSRQCCIRLSFTEPLSKPTFALVIRRRGGIIMCRTARRILSQLDRYSRWDGV